VNEITVNATKPCRPYRLILYNDPSDGPVDTSTVVYDSNNDSSHNVNDNTFKLKNLAVGNYAAVITNSCGERVGGSNGYYNISITEAYSFGASVVFSGFPCLSDNFGTAVIKVEGAAIPITWTLKNNSNNQVTVSSSDNSLFTTQNYDPNFDTQNFTITIPNLAEANYTFSFTDGNGCSEEEIVQVKKPEEIENELIVAESVTALDCNGDSDGKLTFIASGGWTEPWNGNTVNPNGWGNPYIFKLMKNSTEYSSGEVVNSVDSNGNQNGYKTSFTGLSAGTYTLTVTENIATNPYDSSIVYKCSKTFTETFTITEPDALTSSASVTNIDCNGNDNGSIDLSVAGGTANYTYAWTKTGNNSYSATTQDLSDLSPGTYNVTITDANDCTATNSFTISEPTELIIADAGLSTEIACFGDNGQIRVNITQGSVANYTYALYQGNSVIQTTTNSNLNHTFSAPAGTYKVRVTDANGCFKETSNITLTQPTNPLSITTDSISNISCKGQSDGSIDLSVAGGTANYTYAWTKTGDNSYSATSQDLSSLSPGTYNVAITDANNCTISEEFVITEPDELSVTGSISNNNGFGITCNGANDGSIDLSVSGGTANYSYSWSTNNGSGLSINSKDQTGLGPGIYNVTVTDANNCSETKSFTITEPDELTFTEIISDTNGFEISCNDANDGSININPSGGTGVYTYNWSTSNGFGINQGQRNQSNLGPGVYTLRLSDSNGCSVSKTFTLVEPDSILVSAIVSDYNGFEVSSNGANDGSINITVIGGYLNSGSAYSYSWTTSDGSGLSPNTEDQTGLSAGTYTVVVTDDNNCQITKVYKLSEPDELNFNSVINTANGFNISCKGDNDGNINITTSGGSGSYVYTWTTTNGSGIIQGDEDQSGLGPGTYNLIIRDSIGNEANGQFVLTEPDQLIISQSTLSDYNNYEVSCFGGADGQIDITPSGGTGVYTYTWATSDGAGLSVGDQDQTGLSSGTYSVTVTDQNNCSVSQSFTLTSPNEIAIIATKKDFNGFNVSCNGSSDGEIDISVSGGYLDSNSPYSYSWTSSDGSGLSPNAEDQTGLKAGIYTITVTDNNGCTKSQDIEIVQPDSLAITEITSEYNGFEISQAGENDGFIDITVTGGTSEYTYLWSTLDGSGLNINSEDQTSLTAGTYTVTVTDTNGCVIEAEYELIEPKELICDIDHDAYKNDVLCYGDATASIKMDITQASIGPYTYTINGTTYLNENYSQSFDNISELTYTFTNLTAGEYVITITDANGAICGSAVKEIRGPDNPLSITGETTNVTCNGAADGTIDITVAGGGGSSNQFTYFYSWTTQDGSGLDPATEDQTGLGPGTYTVVVTDINDCSITESYTITQSPPLTYNLDSTKNITCNGDNDGEINITVRGGTANYSYEWITSNGSGIQQGEQDQSGLGPGDYKLILRDGCNTFEYLYTITTPDVLEINLDEKVNILCYDASTGAIGVTVSGGTLPYNYVWKDNFGNVYDRNVGNVFNDGDLSNIPAGIYNLTVTDANGCITTFSTELTQPDDLIIDIQKTDLNCYNSNNGTITITPTGGVPPYSYSWSDFGNGNVRNGLSAGSYTVTITDSNGCEEVREIEIDNAELFDVNPTITPVSCFGANDGSIEMNFEGGVDPISFTWSDDSTAGQNRYNLSPGIYSVLIVDASGCEIQRDFTIIEPQEISIAGVLTDATDCDNPASGSIDLQVSGGNAPYTFIWSNGETSEDISGLIANNYLVKVTDSKGCTAEKEFVINRQDDLEINLETNFYAVCETREVYQKNIISVSGGVAPYTIEWSNGLVSGNNDEIMDTKIEGSYQVTVTDFLGCSESIVFQVDTPEIGLPDFDYTSFYLNTFNALSTNDPITFTNLSTEEYFDVHWDFGDGNTSKDINAIHTYTKRGVYDVTLAVEFILGCSYSITKQIYVGDSYEIVIPNAFTPNSDGYNDTFRPVYYGFTNIILQVFDTWGNLIYSEEATTNKLNGWDGKINGIDAENGNYFYQVSGVAFSEDLFTKNGSFTLIK
ncbi:MAG: gliding motility-associated C-terminal domain-containing protein, partial [Flavobacteriaceae bacterium]|nr:gliding motility-associated C-terminal domain-containing protein [Flavobacteriaceae bacterium]